MSLMEGLEELRGSINTETAKHLIDAERDRSKFNDSGCICPLCASRIHLLALLDRAVKSEARIAEAAKLHRPVEGIHGRLVCSHRHCVDDSQDQCAWPCETAIALGLNEGSET